MNSWVYPATEEGDDDHRFLRYAICFLFSVFKSAFCSGLFSVLR